MLLLETILVLSIAIQLTCAILSLRLITITGYLWGWLALALAVSLMALRRAVSLYSLITEGESSTILSTELIALAISILMLIGIINIRPILKHLFFQKSNLEKLNAQLRKEMEQRKKAQEKTNISEEKFRKLAEYSPVFIWKSNTKGLCDYFNAQWLKFRGRTLEEEKNMGWTEGLHPEDKEQTINQYMDAFRKRQNFTLEYRIKNKDNEYRWFYDIGAPMYDDNKNFIGYIGSCIDITERRNMEKALKTNEQKFRKVVNALPQYITYLDKNLRYKFANSAYRKELQLKPREIKGKHKIEILGKHSYEKLKPYIDKALKGKKVHYCENLTINDKIYSLEGTLIPDFNNKGEVVGYYAVHNDITHLIKIQEELEESRNQLKKLSSYQQNLIEQERSHIAREIHDELGQYLSAIHMGLSWLKKQINRTDRKMHTRILELIEMTNVTLQKVKKLATELHPNIIDDMGMLSAIEWYVDEFEKQSKIRCDLYLPDKETEINIDKRKAIHIYRIVQEALNNVYRHAEASKVEVSMKQNKKEITLEIKDNGIGCDLSENQATDNLGVIGMKERAFIMDATFSIKGNKGRGTQITINIPIK